MRTCEAFPYFCASNYITMKSLFYPKLFSVLKSGYTKKQLVNDTLAGIIVGIVALPLAIAFAVASGVAPHQGIITAVVAGLLISLLGGSRVQIGGPTGAFIVIVYGIVAQYGLSGLLISTVLAGVILVAFGVLRLGALLKYIPHPLIVGFTSGIALVIFSTQIKDALGLSIDEMPSEFIEKWTVYFHNLDKINFYALGVTISTMLLVLLTPKVTSKIPGSFIAILVITIVVQIFDLPVATIETVFGEIPNKISFSMPEFKFDELFSYVTPAITIALLGAIESLLSAVVADGMIGGNHRSNTELIAQGIANIVTPFFGGIPATGAIARTATNIKNGGRTPVAGIIHAITLLLIMLFFGSYAKLIPMSCLAGILIIVAYNMSEWRTFYNVLQSSKFDIIVLLVTFVLTVIVDLTIAIEIGIVLSALLFMKRMADSAPSEDEDNDPVLTELQVDIPAGVNIYEINGPFFFASARQYSAMLKHIGNKSKVLVIRMRYVPFIDVTGIYNLKNTITALKKSGIQVLISGIQPEVLQELKRSGVLEMVGSENVLQSFDDAIEYSRRIVMV